MTALSYSNKHYLLNSKVLILKTVSLWKRNYIIDNQKKRKEKKMKKEILVHLCGTRRKSLFYFFSFKLIFFFGGFDDFVQSHHANVFNHNLYNLLHTNFLAVIKKMCEKFHPFHFPPYNIPQKMTSHVHLTTSLAGGQKSKQFPTLI